MAIFQTWDDVFGSYSGSYSTVAGRHLVRMQVASLALHHRGLHQYKYHIDLNFEAPDTVDLIGTRDHSNVFVFAICFWLNIHKCQDLRGCGSRDSGS